MPSESTQSPNGEKQPFPSPLVFRPDPRKVARLTLIRRGLMWTALVVLGISIFIIIRYRPRPMESERRATGILLSDYDGFATGESSERKVEESVDSVEWYIQRVRADLRLAVNLWQSAVEMKPLGPMTTENAKECLSLVEAASATADSASQALARARQGNDRLTVLSRSLPAREAYRLSVLRARLTEYIALLAKDEKEHGARFAALSASCRAALAGDQAEAEVKANVATGYQRKLESRQRTIKRQAADLEEIIRKYLAER